ncbi:restriction endonuclease subunit S [Escherichia coli]|uniref:restriction endonuclease subunit S n=1 Tax=Escherichia coli TaxID=562 RepID=UPI000F0A1CA6|nr:restriction endonuclease subunit S [Escherichia coli]
MGSKWERITVADVCTSIVDCVNKTAPVVEYPTNYKMIRTPNIRSGKVTLDGCRFVEKEVYETWTRRSKPQKGDVLLTREAPLGEVGIITTDENIFLGQRIMQYRADKNKIDPYFLLYSFLSPDLQQQFSMHEGSGSVVSHIRVGDCSKFEINLPPLEIQKSIVKTLKCLDDRIEINTKISQTLEQMSQTLFKSWFVDFDPVIDNALDAGNPIPEALQTRAKLRQKVRNSADFKPLPAEIRSLFPSEFEETEVGYLPAKWIYSGLSKLIDIKHGFAFKGEYFSETKTNQILLTPGNVRIGGGFKFDKLKYYKGEIPKDYIFGVDDIFVSMTDLSKECDSLGYAARVPSREDTQFLHNQRLGRVILGKHPSSVKEFIYQVLISQNYRNTVLGSVTGTTVKHTSPSKILSHVISHSENGEVERKFDSICSNISLAISRNNENNRILLKLRDTLLPKLISGELSLEDLPDLTTNTEAA